VVAWEVLGSGGKRSLGEEVAGGERGRSGGTWGERESAGV
jgi:hypothetical protein